MADNDETIMKTHIIVNKCNDVFKDFIPEWLPYLFWIYNKYGVLG